MVSCVKSMKNEIEGETVALSKHILGKQSAQRVFGTAKVGDRGQVVIPKEAREAFHIDPGDTLLIVGDPEVGLISSRPEVLNDLADDLLKNLKKGK